MNRMRKLFVFILSLILMLAVHPEVYAETAFESVILHSGETNAYSETITFNAGLQDEYSFIGYFLPEGRYFAKNLTRSETTSVFFVRSKRTVFKNGREEPYEVSVAAIIPKDEKVEFEINHGQYVYIYGKGDFEITPSDGQDPIASDPLTQYGHYSYLDAAAVSEETVEEPQRQNEHSVYLDDRMGYYSDADGVEALLKEAADHTGWNVGVVTCDYDYDPNGSGAGIKAEEIYDEVFGVDSDGVLYLCDVGTRYICVANGARKYVVGQRFDSLLDEVNSKYMNYDDLGSVKAFANGIKDCYDRGEVTQDELTDQGYDTFDNDGYYHVDGKEPFKPSDLVIPAGAGIIAAIISVVVVVFKYRVPAAVSADTYLEKNTVDIYKRKNQIVKTRHYSYSNSSLSRGGGGYHGGGGGFSGGHHGGGGVGGHR
ncbi:MAG: hypothetical protein J6I96_00640 [Oscillospiraceae bacterium]|nr:hypothetical protein [Oscillospiraceae bacterium]